jgi:hypothetical protein
MMMRDRVENCVPTGLALPSPLDFKRALHRTNIRQQLRFELGAKPTLVKSYGFHRIKAAR